MTLHSVQVRSLTSFMDEKNPVVLLTNDTWHIVESSRGSRIGLCGQAIRERRAHARLRTVGAAHICPRCLALFEAQFPDS